MNPRKLAFIFGTRPEAIKLAPLIRQFQQYPQFFITLVIVTGQHRELLDQVLHLFQVTPDYDLGVMGYDQALDAVVAKTLVGLGRVLAKESPDLVVVQGDTATTFAGALAAFYQHVPVAHVEAGLRTGDRRRPFPEEVNRRLGGVLADLHFAATAGAKENLLREGIPAEAISVVGNTVVDALFWVLDQPYQFPPELARLLVGGQRRHILVTMHRRESHGSPLRGVCQALLEVVRGRPDVEVIFPVHLNPRVQSVVMPLLRGSERIHLLPSLDYQSFVQVMRRVRLVLTDSGGIQEEAPSLGVPVLVLREVTERPEAELTGAVKVIGTDPAVMVREVSRLLADERANSAVAGRLNPFGDGRASMRIAARVAQYFGVVVPIDGVLAGPGREVSSAAPIVGPG